MAENIGLGNQGLDFQAYVITLSSIVASRSEVSKARLISSGMPKWGGLAIVLGGVCLTKGIGSFVRIVLTARMKRLRRLLSC